MEEGFQPRRSIRVENMRMAVAATDSAASSQDHPSSSSRDPMTKMKAGRPSKTRKYSSSKQTENVESKSISVTECQLPPETTTKKRKRKRKDSRKRAPRKHSPSKPNQNVEPNEIVESTVTPETDTTKKKRKRKDSRTRVPRRAVSPFDTRQSPEKIRRHCALSLKKFNQICAGYVLIKPLCSYVTGFPLLYHCNFIARPEKASDDSEDKLFFGELKFFGYESKRPVVLRCTVCCILGDPRIETGIQGCKFCKCEHPVDGEFRKSYKEDLDWDFDKVTGF